MKIGKILLLLLMLILTSGCVFEGNVYISFETNGGSIIKKQLVKEDMSLPDTVKEGYEFIGWYYDEDLIEPFDESKTILESIKLFARWESASYSVVFRGYDNWLIEAQLVEYGKDAIEPVAPKRNGYTFKGWDNSFTNITSDLVVKAIYEAEFYTLSFNTNGGPLINDITDLKPGDTVNLPITSRVGYLFKGWFYDDALNQPFDKNKVITSDINLYAKWEAITFEVVFKDASDRTIKSQIVAHGNAAVAPTPPAYEGQKFVRWDLDFDNITSNLVVKAIYETQCFKVSFNTAGGSQVTDITNINYKETVNLPVSIRDGYIFKGWRYGGQVFTQDILITTSVLLEAVWESTGTFTITFDSNGGTLVGEMTVMVNDQITLPTLARSEFEFMGWKLGSTILESTFIYTYEDSIHLTASWTPLVEPFSIDGKKVVYRGGSTQVMIPMAYTPKQKEFRAAWVTAFTGDIAKFNTKLQFQAELNSVLDVLESYNMNAIIFHIRATNDALYDSDLNPKSIYIPGANFEEWDYLEWFIGECHRRGIEFHAWLNPYRIKAYGYNSSTTPAMVASSFSSNNAASNPDNILMTYRSDETKGAILNPGRKEVRDFVVATCMEIIERYDIDAIHFDDYFYAQMSPNVTVLSEPDQGLYEQYIVQNPGSGYSKFSASNKSDWRREQINIFIKQLSDSIRSYNNEFGRSVELGISPTGIYKNGNGIVTYDVNGNAVTSGSNTLGQEHYSSYLFCDSKKWIDEEWIDYIVPQTYWGFTHTVAGYADVVDWWVKVVKNKKVKLYTGMGLYMADSTTAFSWSTSEYESSNQILYNTKHDLIQGTVIFSYRYMKKSTALGMKVIKEQYWNSKIPTA